MRKTIAQKKYFELLRWLIDARTERGLTIRQLGEKLGKPSSYVTKTELGERRLDIHEYVVYCKALSVDPREGIAHLE